ncbi:hypothetical protein AAFM79_02885 [Trichormus azollae HNT15244]
MEEEDLNFEKWKQKLMAGEFKHTQTQVLTAVAKEIKQYGGDLWQSYIANLVITIDIIVSSRLEQYLCIRVTSFSESIFSI